MAVDLSRVRFRPGDLPQAAARVLEAPAPARPTEPGVLAVGPVAEATAETVGAFAAWAFDVVERREAEIAGFARGALDDVGDRFVREAVAQVRHHDEQAIREAVARLTRDLSRAFAEPSRVLREARVMSLLGRERGALDSLDESAEERVVEIAESRWIWAGTPDGSTG